MRFLKVFIVAMIFVASSLSSTFANDIQETRERPDLKITGNNIYSLDVQKPTNIVIPIVNTSAHNALDVLINVKVSDNSQIEASFLNNSNRVNSILRGGSHNINLSLYADKSIPSGKYPITLEYSFTSIDKQSFIGSGTFYVKIENQNITPILSLNNIKTSKDTVGEQDNFDINATLENISKAEAKNIAIDIVGLEESNISVIGNSSLFLPSMSANGSNNVKFSFKTNNLTKEGSNKITIKLSYKDNAGKDYTKDYFAYVNVSKNGTSNQKVNLKISSLVGPTGKFNVGQSGTFKLRVKNLSTVSAKGVKISTKLPENIVPTSNNTIILDEILPNQEKEVSFMVAPTTTANTQTYSIGFIVEYGKTDSTGQAPNTSLNGITLEQYSGFNVNNPNPKKQGDKVKTSVPKIIISKYQSNPSIVEAGKSFTLSMNFKNTHQTKTVRNIKIYLTVDDKTEEKGNVFAPDNSSTTFFIDSIGPKQEMTHTFNLFAVPDAKPRSYTVNVNLEYEDDEANEYKSTELVGVNVKQKASLEIGEIVKTDLGSAGTPMNVNFQLYNTGKVTLSNLLIKLEGEGIDASNATNFIGNFTPGSTEYYDASFTPLGKGEKNIKIIITYNDTDGKQIETVEQFKVDVEERSPLEDLVQNTSPTKPNKKFPTKMVVIVISILLAVGIGIFVFVKKAKVKKELDFND